MAEKVKKVVGEYPIDVAVIDQVVSFDENGEAEVDEEVAAVLRQIPGYEFEAEEEEAEAEETAKPAPKKPAPRKPAPKKAE